MIDELMTALKITSTQDVRFSWGAIEEGGKLARHAVQQGGAGLRLLALQLLDLLPVEEDLLRRVGLHVPKDMGMAAAELLVDPAQDVGDGEEAGLVRHLGVKDDLEGEVAELLFQLGRIVLVDGLQDLVGLLQQVRLDARVGLLAIPGAAVLAP